jgi:two-component sensor histidine kinase
MIGKNIFDNLPQDLARKRKAMVEQVVNTGKPVTYQDKREKRYFDSNLYPIFDKTGEVIQVAICAKDITEQKQAEFKILKLLNEKEILLKEVHHRIKNNMNTLKSMFSLQLNATRNPEIIGVLHVAMNRIALMSKIYEQLYQKPGIQDINIRSVINDLVVEIKESFESSQSCNISLEIDVEDISVKAKQSFYLGIIINELVTNAYKYAFSNRKNGIITILVKETETKALQITVQDNGVGISQDLIDQKSYGFGLKLVKIFVKQYKGQLNIINDGGTIVKVKLVKED